MKTIVGDSFFFLSLSPSPVSVSVALAHPSLFFRSSGETASGAPHLSLFSLSLSRLLFPPLPAFGLAETRICTLAGSRLAPTAPFAFNSVSKKPLLIDQSFPQPSSSSSKKKKKLDLFYFLLQKKKKKKMEDVPESKDFSFPRSEEHTLAWWDEVDAFEEQLRRTEGGKPFVFYDGPPFATGLPHYGHLLAGTIKASFLLFFFSFLCCLFFLLSFLVFEPKPN